MHQPSAPDPTARSRFSWQLGAVLALLVACAPEGAVPAARNPAGEIPAEVPVLRVGAQGIAADLVPRDTAIPWYQFWPMYDSLTQLGKDYRVEPSLAERWELAPDGLSWTFTLRRDVRWPDGSPLTAQDVKFTIESLIEQNTSIRARIPAVIGARLLDDDRVELSTSRVDVSVPNNGAVLWIFPRQAIEQIGWGAFTAQPFGSGPYELVEYRSADLLRYRKKSTPHPFRSPVANELVIRTIPEPAQLIAGLRSGELDLVPAANFSVEQIGQLKNAGFQIEAPLASSVYLVMMYGAAQTRRTPLRDRRVRYAINYAVDRFTMARQFYGTYAQPTGQQAVPGSLYFDPDAPPWPFDPQRAKQLLAEAGYPNGFRLEIGIVFTPLRSPAEVMLAVKQYLADVGIDTPVLQTEVGVWTDYAFGRNNTPQPDFLATFSLESDGFYTNWRAVAGCDRGGSIEKAWTCTPEGDRTFDAALSEPDPTRRSQVLRQANRVFREDAPVLFLVNGPQFFVSSPKLRGLTLPTPQFYNLDSVYLVR
ncbi:MAG: diguanylate phosphodiesterase [Dehalococcoidia bacterium]|nr:MAG: diguanylate phosphodiesterase [Dehalococcoidia bacterium]